MITSFFSALAVTSLAVVHLLLGLKATAKAPDWRVATGRKLMKPCFALSPFTNDVKIIIVRIAWNDVVSFFRRFMRTCNTSTYPIMLNDLHGLVVITRVTAEFCGQHLR